MAKKKKVLKEVMFEEEVLEEETIPEPQLLQEESKKMSKILKYSCTTVLPTMHVMHLR